MESNSNQIYNPQQRVHPIHGNIKCLLAFVWIALFNQIAYLSLVFNFNLNFSYWEIIFNVILTLSLNLIAVFLSLSNNLYTKRIYLLFKVSFILSIVCFVVSLLSGLVIYCALRNKLRGFLLTPPLTEALYDVSKIVFGSIISCIRFMELLPFLLFLCYLKPVLYRDKGSIEHNLRPQTQGITDNNYFPILNNQN